MTAKLSSDTGHMSPQKYDPGMSLKMLGNCSVTERDSLNGCRKEQWIIVTFPSVLFNEIDLLPWSGNLA